MSPAKKAAEKAEAPAADKAVEAPAEAKPSVNAWSLAIPVGEPAPTVESPEQPPAEKGYIGWVPDETPNEDYTVTGVLAAQQKPAKRGFIGEVPDHEDYSVTGILSAPPPRKG